MNEKPAIQGSYDDLAELVARYPGILEQNKHQLAAVLATEGRGFLWPALFVGAQILSTSTKYTYTTSTITSTSVISCIVSASFYGGSTQSCRRKRAAAEIEANEDQMPFNPSAVIRLILQITPIIYYFSPQIIRIWFPIQVLRIRLFMAI